MQNAPNRPVRPADSRRRDIGVVDAISRIGQCIWVPAVQFDGPAPATYISPTATVPGHWLLQEADGTTLVYCTTNAPSNWLRGHVEPVIHYGVVNPEGGDTVAANILWQFGWSFQQHKIAIPALTTKTATSSHGAADQTKWLVTRPTITIDSTYLSPAFTTTEINPKPEGAYVTTVPPKHDALYFQIGRQAGHASDTSIENVLLYGVEFLFFPHYASVGKALLERTVPEDHR